MIFKGKAESVKAQGDALIKSGGQDFFVPFVWENEEVEFSKTAPQRGRLEKVLTPSEERIAPLCPYFTKCGGCKLQHVKYEAYLAFKAKTLADTLAQRGLVNIPLAPVIAIPPATRRRATFNSVSAGASHWFGFNAEKSKTVVSIKNCPVLLPELSSLIVRLKKLCTGITGDVAVTKANNGFDIMITADKYPGFAFLEALGDFSRQENVLRWTYRYKEEALPEILLQTDVPKTDFAGIDVALPAGAFLQPSREGQEALTALVLAAVSGYDNILDLFCGLGCFTIPVAMQNKNAKVYGYDVFVPAIFELNKAGVPNLKAEARNLYENPLTAAELDKFPAVILDPPRAGAMAAVERLAMAKTEKVVYVSCNPATFARDAKTLLDGGYDLEKITPVDQFIFSAHLELVAVFSRTRK
ncbi:MAG: class I SAM-dependent RNA methyltransferase [Alphaproteobacteria bacterium]|nr:class I SAM-dependent RNA methyltransferase [Alphaproteobacteria bacterium]